MLQEYKLMNIKANTTTIGLHLVKILPKRKPQSNCKHASANCRISRANQSVFHRSVYIAIHL